MGVLCNLCQAGNDTIIYGKDMIISWKDTVVSIDTVVGVSRYHLFVQVMALSSVPDNIQGFPQSPEPPVCAWF